MVDTGAYVSWTLMKARCYCPKNNRYYRYGARGITVCPEWKDSFLKFLEDMGDRPEGMTLDRLNNELPYCKSNCRWATKEEQSRNKSNLVILTVDGLSMCLQEWANKTGLNRTTIAHRLRKGWSHERAIKTPVLARDNARGLLEAARRLGFAQEAKA